MEDQASVNALKELYDELTYEIRQRRSDEESNSWREKGGNKSFRIGDSKKALWWYNGVSKLIYLCSISQAPLTSYNSN